MECESIDIGGDVISYLKEWNYCLSFIVSTVHFEQANFRGVPVHSHLVALLLAAVCMSAAWSQDQNEEAARKFVGPTKDVTFHVIALIESDDQNRRPYDGPARDGLTAAGFERMVIAGSATAMVTIGQRSEVSGTSRYGHLSVSTSMLNTTDKNEVQVKINLQTRNQSPISINTSARASLGRWFLVGATDSRIGLPVHADDGKRFVAVMRVDDGVLTLD